MIKKRLICLLTVLALALTPIFSLAEGTWAGDVDLTFSMNAAAYPAEDMSVMGGVADLLNVLHMTSTLTLQGNPLSPVFYFDSDVSVGLNGKDGLATATLYGLPSNIGVKSPLLGDQSVMLNAMAWIEFGLKTYSHLGMPLQTVALCTSTFANYDAFTALRGVWERVMDGEGSRAIDRDTVMELASSLAETAAGDRAFGCWVQALLMEAGYSDMVMESLETLPDHVDSFLGDDGVTITVTDDGETWTTGETTLFTRTGDDWTLTLPASVEGYTVTAARKGLSLDLQLGMEEDDDILHLTAAAAGLPDGIITEGKALLTLDVTGAMLPENHLRWEGAWSAADNAEGLKDYTFALTEKNTETDADMLTIQGSVKEKTPDHTPFYAPEDVTGVNLLSVYEETLADFINAVKTPVIKGMLPILLEVPASSIQSIFAWLDQYGVLTLLTEGLSS